MQNEIREYVDLVGDSPFADWFRDLDPTQAARITVAITRVALGNLSNVKGVGGGVLEYRIDSGPGYRIYFGKDGDHLVILLAGGTKRHQQKDIQMAAARWFDYKQRKRAVR